MIGLQAGLYRGVRGAHCGSSHSALLTLLLPACAPNTRVHSPTQVHETQKTIRDGRTGMESMTIARGLGEQVRAARGQGEGGPVRAGQGSAALAGCCQV